MGTLPYLEDFLQLDTLSPAIIQALLHHAQWMKQHRHTQQSLYTPLRGQTWALYFEKPSCRTRVSFEVGIRELGGTPMSLRQEEIGLGVRESVADVARTLQGYVHGVMIRTFAHEIVTELAHWSKVPIINGLSDTHHPCQAMADMLTLMGAWGGRLEAMRGKTLMYVGDGNNVAVSLMQAAVACGLHITLACPEGYTPSQETLDALQPWQALTGSRVAVHTETPLPTQHADAIYTDVWTSMGQEESYQERLQIFKPYQVNEAMLTQAKPNTLVLHCLPAHREEEITHGVLEAHAETIFTQAENRLHAQKAILSACALGAMHL
jgi:ornithine carbamoyltransferase